MTILELIRQLLPNGTDAFAIGQEPAAVDEAVDYTTCPTWPPDLFAVIGSIIDRSGCYTLASPNRDALEAHQERLDEISTCAQAWNHTISVIPETVQVLWEEVATTYAGVPLAAVSKDTALVSILLILFAAADEASLGMGWDVDPRDAARRKFASVAFAALTRGDAEVSLPYESRSLCVMVPAEQAIVLPKSITSSVGCTIRSLSHHLALLPPVSVLEPRWILSSKKAQQDTVADPAAPYPLRLLLVPFPFTIHASSFKLSSPRQKLGTSENHVPAYFELIQNWLKPSDEPLTAERLATELILNKINRFQSGNNVVDVFDIKFKRSSRSVNSRRAFVLSRTSSLNRCFIAEEGSLYSRLETGNDLIFSCGATLRRLRDFESCALKNIGM